MIFYLPEGVGKKSSTMTYCLPKKKKEKTTSINDDVMFGFLFNQKKKKAKLAVITG